MQIWCVAQNRLLKLSIVISCHLPFVVTGNSLKDVIPLWSAIFCLGIQPGDVVLGTLCMQSSLNSLKNTTIVQVTTTTTSSNLRLGSAFELF